MHWIRQQELAKVTGQAIGPDGKVAPLPATAKNEALAATVSQQAQTISQQQAMLTRAADLLAAVPGEIQARITSYHNSVVQPMATTLGTAQQAVSTLTTTTIPALQTDIGKRLRKDQADATAFPLGVPAATAMDKAVQKSELAGGIQRPYRVFQNVGSTPVSAYLRPGQSAPIVDALGLGQVFALTSVRIKTLTNPGLASTITIYRNGTPFFTQQVILANLPAVGKVLDILSLATSLPADMVLPATITASASAGSFEIITDGLLK